jgi:circadian clock protein KaiC
VRRLPTGVPGLDLVLGGGLERGAVTVLAGAPGTGKTILAQHICFSNATSEHRAIYYTTVSEPHSKLIRHLEQFDFFAPDALGTKVEYVHLGGLIRQEESGGLEALVSEVVRKTMEEQPAVVVIDSAKALQDFADGRQMREALYDLTSRLAHTDATLILVGEYSPDEVGGAAEFSLADSIIQLEYEPREPVDRRWLRVVKMRGARHREGKHTFRIGVGGFEIFPRIETLEPDEPADVTGRIHSGVKGLDELMSGGIGSGEATIVVGPSGIGKTILGLHFVNEGIAQGERCLYVTFQDTPGQLVKMAGGFGWDLGTARDRGQLLIHHVPLGDLDLDILASGVRKELVDGSVRRVVIDSLAEMVYAARESDRFPAFARSLTGFIRASGASLTITSEATTLGPSPEPAGGVMFLFHNVILLRYIELDSAAGRALNIVKMRNSAHDKNVHRFDIDDGGMTIGARLDELAGVLGWSALRSSARGL